MPQSDRFPRRFARSLRRELDALRPTTRLRVTRRIARLLQQQRTLIDQQLPGYLRSRAAGEELAISLQRQLVDLDRHLVAMRKAVSQEVSLLRQVQSESVEQRKILNVLRARLSSEVIAEVAAFTRKQQLSLEQTLQKIVDEELSFARFGDGEFRLMFEVEYNIRFQSNSPALRAALTETLTTEPPAGLLLGFPQLFRGRNGTLVWASVWEELKPLLPDGLVFGNSHVSRPIAFSDLGDRAVELWRQVWQDREVCIITGEGSRFELVPALFDNLAGHRYLRSTPKNAFADLDRLVAEVERGPQADLYLVSLGPAGTVLTAMLARRGHRAIDIGHISDSYRNVYDGAAWPESLPVAVG